MSPGALSGIEKRLGERAWLQAQLFLLGTAEKIEGIHSVDFSICGARVAHSHIFEAFGLSVLRGGPLCRQADQVDGRLLGPKVSVCF